MFTLRVVQAQEGDSLILRYGADGAPPRQLLIDGGPRGVWESWLAPALADGASQLDTVILTHVDTDHSDGLLDMFAALRDLKDDGQPLPVEIGGLWINEFERTVDRGRSLTPRLRTVLGTLGAAGVKGMSASDVSVRGIAQGHRLVVLARQLGLELNKPTKGEPLLVGTIGAIALGPLRLHIVGPTERNLEALRREWEDWLDKQEQRIRGGRIRMAAMADKTVPNLSSIQLLAELGGKRVLLTGDGRGDHLLDGLEAGGHLDDDGGIDVEVLKLPHHGSNRNVDRDFFERVRAKVYVASANGKYDNPDADTLGWIVRAARKQGRPIEIVVTNPTPATDELVANLPPAKYGYRLTLRADPDNYIDVDIAGA